MVDKAAREAHARLVRLGKAIRRERGAMSQTDLAVLAKSTQPTVSRWERGDLVPSLDEVYNLETGLGLPAGALLRAAGYVEDIITIEDAIRSDERLTPVARRVLLAALRELSKP